MLAAFLRTKEQVDLCPLVSVFCARGIEFAKSFARNAAFPFFHSKVGEGSRDFGVAGVVGDDD